MSKDLFGYTIPSLLRGLGVLSAYLQSIQKAVAAERFMEGKLLKARLAADMLPLGRQIQIACDNAKNDLARLTVHNAASFNDEEKYLVQYRHRVEKNIDNVRRFHSRALDSKEDRPITL